MEESRNIYTLIPLISKELEPVGKNGVNSLQKWTFQRIEDITSSLHPILAKYQVTIIPELLDYQETTYDNEKQKKVFRVIAKVKYRLYAPDGSYVSSIVTGEGMANDDKSHMKAFTYAFKTFLKQVFCIAIDTDKDPDETTIEPLTIETNSTRKLTTDEKKAKLWNVMQSMNIHSQHGQRLYTALVEHNANFDDEAVIKANVEHLMMDIAA